jgi:Protein of unknown function, DUF547
MAFPLFARTVLLGRPCPPERRLPLAEIDHSPFDTLLGRFVDDHGRVGYAAWKADAEATAALHSYLVALGRADADAPATRPDTLAFWINAYNALTLAGVLHVHPARTVRDHTGVVFGFNLWKNLRLHVGGKEFSLSDIEHDILRPLGDPRVHFAIVCGANGCPVLSRTAYTPSELDGQLAAGTRAFLARPDAVTFDPARRVVRVSKLFKWYADDLGEELAAVVRSFGDGVKVEYQPYDWGLNEQ